jgi:hypothetical protein
MNRTTYLAFPGRIPQIPLAMLIGTERDRLRARGVEIAAAGVPPRTTAASTVDVV